MKTKLAILMNILTVTPVVLAQTADDFVAQGRAHLGGTNLIAANNSFSNAVALSSNHQEANVLYAATRLLSLPLQPGGSTFLNRLGVPLAGRDIYDWQAFMPSDTNRVPYVPPALNTSEGQSVMSTNFLPAVIAAQGNLAKVTNPNFLLYLSSNETRMAGVTLDYGDILLLRSGLYAAQYACYTIRANNLDVPLCPIRYSYDVGELTIEKMLQEHPDLLTYETTNDLNSAKVAFQNFVNVYFAASEWIRNRPSNIVRLFNYDPSGAADEEEFRWTLRDLTNSLVAAVPLTIDGRYTIFLSSHFSGRHPMRSFLPRFRGNDFVMETSPDVTYGGLVQGLTYGAIDEFLADALYPIPSMSRQSGIVGARMRVQAAVAPGRGYVIQVSTNLLTWSNFRAFFAHSPTVSFDDPESLAAPRRFYRIVDRTSDMPPPNNDMFANRRSIPGINIMVTGYTASATSEPFEPTPAMGGRTTWWAWTSTVSAEVDLVVQGLGECAYARVYTGSSLGDLTMVQQGYESVRFNAQSGVTYQISLEPCGEGGGVTLVITRPPLLMVSGSQTTVVPAPGNFSFSASGMDPDGSIGLLKVWGWPLTNISTTNTSLFFECQNVSAGEYHFYFQASDKWGSVVGDSRYVRVTPPNDNFANRILISGAPLVVAGTNSGATGEFNEPSSGGSYGANSVWWSWSAAQSGPVTINCTVTKKWGASTPLVRVYTGTSLGSLAEVATSVANFATSSQLTFQAVAGQAYQVVVNSYPGNEGTVTLRFIPSAPPQVSIIAPTNNATFPVGTALEITATAADPDGTISRVDFYRYGSLIGTRSAPPYSVTWTNTSWAGWHGLQAYAVDNAGVGTLSPAVYVNLFWPALPNDRITNATILTGSYVYTTGSNIGATWDPDEPWAVWDTDYSVWWRWTAPSWGLTTITTQGSSFDTLLAVYDYSSYDLEAFNDNYDSSNGTSRVQFYAVPGQEYLIFVGGSPPGSIWLQISQP